VDPLVGTLVADDFEIIELIGTGGWSRVYRAKQLSTDRFVALKVLHSHLLFDAESVARFAREAESGASLDHDNICRVFDFDRLSTGQPYIAMEYMDGESLAALIAREGRLSAKAALPIFISFCRGLAAAHKQGIIHRDIKPANLFILKNSQVKILDFGLAKIIAGRQPDITQTGTAFGTVQYMSPQQVMGARIDSRSDIYSLGCVMYETMTGKKVFEGNTAYEVMDQHVKAVPSRFSELNIGIEMPNGLESIILKALEKNPQDRYQTIEDILESLEKLDLNSSEPVASKTSRPANIWVAVILTIVTIGAVSLALACVH
ncbi:MAG: serine/threonine protein kinase, partial [Cyanobacteria bacterium]|nr:serine/threonine protein kinase [Cyanobacteriota bacterium]